VASLSRIIASGALGAHANNPSAALLGLSTNGICSSLEFFRAGKSSFTCEIAVLDENFDYKMMFAKENPFHVTNPTSLI